MYRYSSIERNLLLNSIPPSPASLNPPPVLPDTIAQTCQCFPMGCASPHSSRLKIQHRQLQACSWGSAGSEWHSVFPVAKLQLPPDLSCLTTHSVILCPGATAIKYHKPRGLKQQMNLQGSLACSCTTAFSASTITSLHVLLLLIKTSVTGFRAHPNSV